jgi:hypothetical protein
LNEVTTKNTTMQDMVLPFKILISPIKTFGQLAQRPTMKGLITLSVLILAATAAAQYASATRIILNINGLRTSFPSTNSFNGWYVGVFASTALGILLYWLVFSSGLALISWAFGGKKISWRVLFVSFGYLLSVFIILYAVRAMMYLLLPSLYFEGSSSWPPMNQTDVEAIFSLISERWSSLYAYQFLTFFPLVAFVWLVILGAIAVRTLHEISWIKAAAVSLIGFSMTFFLFGLP